MKVGYARVSTHEQNLSLQIDELKKSGCTKIFTDKISGSKVERPGIQKALDFLREGDSLVVWRLDRLGRSLKHLIEVITLLEERKIGFSSLQESIDTTTSGGKLIFHIFGALAEFERNLIRERTKAGLAAARARGRKGGRPRVFDDKKIKLARNLYDSQKHPISEICETLEVSKSTLYNYLKD
ncbi:MAG: recombinase family protein [Anaerolineaceae bacterium]|nr:recombinase family protein [Anaerolineaceae bacterium]